MVLAYFASVELKLLVYDDFPDLVSFRDGSREWVKF